MTAPRISIVIPCYNAADTLQRCLDSVAKQTLDCLEVIAIDDCSQDSTLAFLKSYQAQPAPFGMKVLEHNPNAGVSTSRNDGMAAASGEFIMFLDADDALESGACSHLLALADKTGADIIACNLHRQDSEGKFSPYTREKSEKSSFTGMEYAKKLHCTSLFDSADAKLFRRSFIQENGLAFSRTVKFGEDTLFTNLAAAKAGKIVIDTDFFGYVYYCTPGSCMNTIDLGKRLSNLQALLEGLSQGIAPGQERLLLRKSKEYIWTIKKHGGEKRNAVLRQLLSSPLWEQIIHPSVKNYGKFKHRLIAWMLCHGFLQAIRFW